jgi:hypothetical protein
MERQRQRGTARRPLRVDDPVAVRRWRANHRLARYGLNKKTFDALLERQGHACGMCREPFEEGQLIFIDHDHSLGCHPEEKRACDKCRRGLLCLRCNVGLGYIERMSGMARAYLYRISAVPVVW